MCPAVVSAFTTCWVIIRFHQSWFLSTISLFIWGSEQIPLFCQVTFNQGICSFCFCLALFLWVNLVLSSDCTRDLWWISFLFFVFLGSFLFLICITWNDTEHVRDEYKSLDIKCSSWNPNQWTWISCLFLFVDIISWGHICTERLFSFFSFSAELRSLGPMQTSGRYNLKCPRLYNLNCVRLLTLRGHSKSKWRLLL